MKLKLAVLKKPTYIIGGIVLFFLVLWLVNRSGHSSGGTVVASSQQDPNAIAAGVALQQAQIGAGVQMASINADLAKNQTEADTAVTLAKIQAVNDTNQTNAQYNIGMASLNSQTQIAENTLSLQGHVVDSNNQLTFNTAKMAYDNANYSTAVNAALTAHLSDNETSAYKTNSLLSIIPTFGNKHNRAGRALSSILNSGQLNAPSTSAVFTTPSLPQTQWVG